MAKRVLLVDDVSGDIIDDNLGGGTIIFSFEDRHYQIDLGLKNTEAFRKDMQKWIDHAEQIEAPPRRGRPAGSGTTTRRRAPSGSGRSKEELANIREWLTKNGHEVNERGRIKGELLALYDEAHAPSE